MTNKSFSLRVSKRSTIALLMAGGIFLWGCSKTQDTAPETRLFGSPPTINSVNLTSVGAGEADCNVTPTLQGYLCEAGGFDPSLFADFPTVTIKVLYTEASFQVSVSDPESTAQASDILLVSASYKTTDAASSKPVEISLVVLDDGSSNQFAFTQVGSKAEDCSQGVCPRCNTAHYNLTSNDTVAGDNLYTRGFAILSNTVTLTEPSDIGSGDINILRNCVASASKQFPAFVDLRLGSSVPFKIEVVDKEGNLTTWPAQPAVTFNQTTYSCSSPDGECACCVLLSALPTTECKGKPGLIGAPGSGFENGLCKSF